MKGWDNCRLWFHTMLHCFLTLATIALYTRNATPRISVTQWNFGTESMNKSNEPYTPFIGERFTATWQQVIEHESYDGCQPFSAKRSSSSLDSFHPTTPFTLQTESTQRLHTSGKQQRDLSLLIWSRLIWQIALWSRYIMNVTNFLKLFFARKFNVFFFIFVSLIRVHSIFYHNIIPAAKLSG